MELQDYLNLITSEYVGQPNFTATLTLVLNAIIQVQSLYDQMIPLFDVSLATGQQLDIIGTWVGITRNVSIPISGVYFSWNSTASQGWNYGTWQSSDEPAEITVLPDDAFRTLIYAKIAANSWDGTTTGAYAIWNQLFTNFTILIQDYQNMTYALIILGGIVDSLTLALITGGYIPLRPEGVEIVAYYTSVDTNPAFAWDVESTYLAGWNQGSWLLESTPS